MIPHYNFYPAAGQTLDMTDPRVTWNGRIWTLQGKPYTVPSTHQLLGRPGTPLAGWYYDWSMRAWIEPSSNVPTAPARAPRPVAPVVIPIKETPVEKPKNVIEALVKHPVAPVLGGLLVLAAHFTDEPSPPAIPDGMPETTQKQWQMIFNQNQQRFARRMELYENIGMMLLGYSSTQAILEALPKKTEAPRVLERRVVDM